MPHPNDYAAWTLEQSRLHEQGKYKSELYSDQLPDRPAYDAAGTFVDRSEVIITDPTTGGQKGQKDVQLHAAPWESLSEIGRVYAFGAVKYADYNFRKGYAWSLSYDACLRHLGLFWNREDTDRDSGLSHLAHAAWHALTLLFFSLKGRGTDDRPT